MFDLCWDGKGFVVDLTHVPDDILEQFIDWRNERVREENQR